MNELQNEEAKATGHDVRQLARAWGVAITPESFKSELEAVRGGYSRNVRRVRGDYGGWVDLLELWPRDDPQHAPLLLSVSGGLPYRTSQVEWLAQFSFSYDPGHYKAGPPAALQGFARVRAFLETLAPTQTKARPYRPIQRHHRRRYEEMPDKGPDDDEEGGTTP